MSDTFLEFKLKRNVDHDPREITAQEGIVAPLFELVMLAALDLVQMLVDAFHRAVFLEQLRCRLLPGSARAGHVVGWIADETFVIDILVGPHAETFDYP